MTGWCDYVVVTTVTALLQPPHLEYCNLWLTSIDATNAGECNSLNLISYLVISHST